MKTDIIIAGAGIAGLIAAFGFAERGYDVVIVDPKPLARDESTPASDLRTTAYLQPSQEFLDHLGLWSHLKETAAALKIMRLVDAGGKDGEIRGVFDFDAAELGDRPFGWNIPNASMRNLLIDALNRISNVTFLSEASVVSRAARSSEIRVGLNTATQIDARLLIGADGRQSVIRDLSGIGVRTIRYGQSAMVFMAHHRMPHQNISTEVHQSGGAFTLVPLPDFETQPRSAIVWMDVNDRIQKHSSLSLEAFTEAITRRSAGVLGPLTPLNAPQIWPVFTQAAKSFTTQRTVLIAEAAHVLPPIGAQGLNLSIRDVISLVELSKTYEIGTDRFLRKYEASRKSDVSLRFYGIDALNRAAMTDFQLFKDLRLAGLKLLFQASPMRRSAMRLGLGASG